MRYKKKIIINGNHLRIKEYSLPINVSYVAKRKDYKKSSDGTKTAKSLYRTRENLIDTINSNVNHWSKFLTLTTKETVLDRQQFLKLFNNFTIQFKREFRQSLKYVGVLERQTKRGIKEGNEGSWHIHLIVFNAQKLAFNRLKKSWIYGSLDIKKVDTNDNLGLYLAKYLTKEDLQQKNKKSILKSRGLNVGVSILDGQINIENMKQTYKCDYNFSFKDKEGKIILNNCTLTEYIIPQGKD